MYSLDAKHLFPLMCFSYKKWVSLTNHITAEIALLLQPECGAICSVPQFVSEPSTSQSRKRDAEVEAMEAEASEQPKERTERSSLDDKLPKMKAVQGLSLIHISEPTRR